MMGNQWPVTIFSLIEIGRYVFKTRNHSVRRGIYLENEFTLVSEKMSRKFRNEIDITS